MSLQSKITGIRILDQVTPMEFQLNRPILLEHLHISSYLHA